MNFFGFFSTGAVPTFDASMLDEEDDAELEVDSVTGLCDLYKIKITLKILLLFIIEQ